MGDRGHVNTVGEPDEGEPHVRFDEGRLARRFPPDQSPTLLGCHFHARVSGRLLERGIRRYYLHRWPSARSMKKLRQRVKELTGRNRNGVKDIRVLISDLNPILRGWGNYFRTGNAASKFIQVDGYVWRRLRSFLVKRYGRNLHAGQADRWTEDWFHDMGLYRLRGTIRYPEAA